MAPEPEHLLEDAELRVLAFSLYQQLRDHPTVVAGPDHGIDCCRQALRKDEWLSLGMLTGQRL
jgi:hypothetical protein